MNEYDKLYNKVELNGYNENEEESLKALEDLNNAFNDIYPIPLYDDEYAEQLLSFLYNNSCQEYKNEILKILKKHSYNLHAETLTIIKELLLNTKNPTTKLHTLSYMPSIESIEYRNDELFLTNTQGTFNIKKASSYYKDNKDIYNYLRLNSLNGKCHSASLWFINSYPSCTALTSLCPNIFRGFFYHTFIVTPNNNVVDLASNSVMSLETASTLYDFTKITETTINDLQDTNFTDPMLYDTNPLLLLALQKQAETLNI
ncbi:MAG: hypothetical protein RSE45_00475 [Bacilli bacterium]